ncbi:MAG: TldD/PmbA family protein [Dehalococcoidia bacterium]|nr:TldD/PmbA family protein [Dehalococcoidia bacterium]
MTSDYTALARHAVDLALRAGAGQCDAFLVAVDESEVTVRLGATDRLVEASSQRLGLRVISGGRTAISATSDLAEDAIERLARETVELAAISAADAFAGLPEVGPEAPPAAELQLYDERLEAMTVEEKLALAVACEDAARAEDRRITNSDGATLSTRAGTVALANSLGFAAQYRSTSVSLAVEVMADDAEGKKRNAYWWSSGRMLHRLGDPAEIGRIAARRAVGQIGARKVATKRVPVVFEPMVAARLLGDLASCLTGSALYRKATFLADHLGETVASPLVTLVDDGTLAGAAGSRPFDGEGVRSRRTALFEEGIFRSFLFDAYSGRRTGNVSTGSASRGPDSLPAPGTSNLVLESRAPLPVASLVEDVADGFYVTELIGHGFNPTTGDFSRGAAGYWIENGRIAFPVTEVNVSGRLPEMLAGIDATGDDLQWFGSTAAPTLRFRELMVSGL